tara:strand:- start:41 stop:913 length:873 start_codon:yes stop_codon:yes gene_type:complete
MQVYASTTFLGTAPTPVEEPLALLAREVEDLDGVELGSTHIWSGDIPRAVVAAWNKPVITHNYFPPARESMVLNIASPDPEIRDASIRHMTYCLEVAAQLGAPLYTIHPGFLAEPKVAAPDAAGRKFDFGFQGATTPYERAFELMVDALGRLCDAAAAHGVALAIETEGSLTSRDVTLMERPEEYDRLFDALPTGLHLNLNLAHTSLAAKGHDFDVADFVTRFKDRIAAVEISHNDGFGDQHRPLEADAPVLDLIPLLPAVPLILEFRCATTSDIRNSARLVRAANPANA